MAEINLLTWVLVTNTALLVLTSVLLLYPVIAYTRNVVYTEGFVLLAFAFLVLTFVNIADNVFEWTTTANAARVLAAASGAAGVWYLAREFISIGSSGGGWGSFSQDPPDEEGDR